MNPKRFIARFRYSEDKPSKTKINSSSQFEILDIHNSLLITETISPNIYSSLERVSANLGINPNLVNLYIRAKGEINAGCYNGIDGGFVVILNSEMATLLENEELDFVIGHELGHLLFEHTKEKTEPSPNGLRTSRAKEISADRIGLVASRSINSTFRAIMKITSGLNDELLCFNISEYLDQLKKFDGIDNSSLLDRSTHPSFLIRSKALILFSESDAYQKLFNEQGKPLSSIDKRIKKQMNRNLERKNELEARNLGFWIACFAALLDKNLSSAEKDYISQEYGIKKLNDFIKLIRNSNKSTVKKIINKNIVDLVKRIGPQALNIVIKEIGKVFNNQNLNQEIMKILKK